MTLFLHQQALHASLDGRRSLFGALNTQKLAVLHGFSPIPLPPTFLSMHMCCSWTKLCIPVIRPKCIIILYHNSSLFIDIFHVMMMFLCCFGLFYKVCNFPVPEQQTQDSAGKSGY